MPKPNLHPSGVICPDLDFVGGSIRCAAEVVAQGGRFPSVLQLRRAMTFVHEVLMSPADRTERTPLDAIEFCRREFQAVLDAFLAWRDYAYELGAAADKKTATHEARMRIRTVLMGLDGALKTLDDCANTKEALQAAKNVLKAYALLHDGDVDLALPMEKKG